MRPTSAGAAARPPHQQRPTGEDGVTLVELLASMLILGVILSATAASLVSFSRASVTNERRVQATAYLNELHERLQTLPWDVAALYEDEIGPLADIGADVDPGERTFEGRDLVLIEGPDPADSDETPGPECSRPSLVPQVSCSREIDGRTYDIYQAVTWVDRSGNGQGDVKRFTTIVSWTALGRTIEQRFDSDRAPTQNEVEIVIPPSVVSFSVTPGSAAIDDTGVLLDGLAVAARFDRGITAAEVTYDSLEDDGSVVERLLPLSPTLFDSARPVAFGEDIAAGARRFPSGPTTFTLTGYDSGVPITAVTTVAFTPPGLTPDDPPPVVTSVLPQKFSINVGRTGSNTGKLQCDLRIDARVDGLDAGGTVTLNYTSGDAQGIAMVAQATVTGSNDLFRITFANGVTSLWDPTDGALEELFNVVARNSDGRSSAARNATSVVTFNSANSNC